jgi:lipopolysaccharide export LptBFGC system permease protein LptF
VARTSKDRFNQVLQILAFFVVITAILMGIEFVLYLSAQPTQSKAQAKPTSAADLKGELLQTQVVQKALQQTGSGSTMAVGKIHKNNIVELMIYTQNNFGHELWVKKIDNTWSLLFEGQQSPPCQMLENAGIEPGVSCFNQDSGASQKTSQI